VKWEKIMPRLIQSRVLRRLLLAAVVVAVLPWSAPLVAQAADPLKDNTSLKFVPENVAFYVASLRLREVYDKVATSKAAAKLKQIPVVQFGWAMAMAQWQNPQVPQLAMFKQALQAPENQQLVAMLKDAMSQEIFIYGGADFGDAIGLLNELNVASSTAQLEAAASNDLENPSKAQFGKILEVINRQGDKLKIPTLVKGAKLGDTQTAVAQLKRLENLITTAFAQQPPLQQRFAREKIGGGEFLTLRLDGSLVPWPMVMQSVQGVDPQQMQQLVTKLSAVKLVISIGLRDKYLLVSIGDDNKHLAQLGQGALLYDRSELAPVRKAADKPLTEVTYASAAFMQQVGGVERQMDQLSGMAKQFLPMAGLSPELEKELAADVEKITTYVKANVPKPGARSGYNYLTPDGFEGFGYSWTTESTLDASKNLTVLNHVGGDPIAFWAARGKSNPRLFDNLVFLVSRAAYYAEKLLLEKGDPQQQDAYTKIREQLQPLASQLATVTRDKLIPAFADGQSALVLDAKSTSETWHVAMPPSDAALPMLEIGMVSGVSDAGLVKEAFGEYFTIAQQILDKLHELSAGDLKDMFPQEIPAIQLAKPQTKDVADATVYFYALPAESGLDAQLAPNAGLSASFLVTSLLPRFTARLLADTSLQGQGPLAKYDRPLAAAGHLDFARLIEALEPWIDYGMAIGLGVSADVDGKGGPTGNIPQQVHDALEVIKCFRGASVVIYQEGNTMVTHVQCRFADLQ
jgi:hypothetical protein